MPPVATSRAHGSVPRRLQLVFPLVAEGSRTNAEQAQWQLCGLLVTLVLAASGGGLTGEFQPRALKKHKNKNKSPSPPPPKKKDPTKPSKPTRRSPRGAAGVRGR